MPSAVQAPANSAGNTGTSSQVNVTGAVTLAGNVTLVDSGSSLSSGLGAYQIGTYGSISGSATVTNLNASTHATLVPGAGTLYLDVYRLASASAHTPEPATLGNFHVGDVASTALSITNSAAADGFSEKLNATIGGTTGSATASGSFASLLAAGLTNSTDLTVGISTSTAGAKSGTATITLNSDGTGGGHGQTSIGTQTVNVSGTVYRYVAPTVNGTTNSTVAVPLGAFHVGDTASGQLTIRNMRVQ